MPVQPWRNCHHPHHGVHLFRIYFTILVGISKIHQASDLRWLENSYDSWDARWLQMWLGITFPKTNNELSLPLKIGRNAPKGKDQTSSNHPFSGAFAVSFRDGNLIMESGDRQGWGPRPNVGPRKMGNPYKKALYSRYLLVFWSPRIPRLNTINTMGQLLGVHTIVPWWKNPLKIYGNVTSKLDRVLLGFEGKITSWCWEIHVISKIPMGDSLQ